MKKLCALTIVIVVALIFPALAGKSAPQSANPVVLERDVSPNSGLDSTYRQFVEGYKKLDAAQVAGLYAEDAIYLSPGNEIQRGRDTIQQVFSDFFRATRENNGNLEISFRITDRVISDTLAYDVGVYKLAHLTSGKETRSSKGKFVVIARSNKEGLWKIRVHSFSDIRTY